MPASAFLTVPKPIRWMALRRTTCTRVNVTASPSLIAVWSPGLTLSLPSRVTPSSVSAPPTVSAVTVAVRFLASASLTARRFGVTTERSRPDLLIAVPRLADRSAPAKRSPTCSRAVATLVAVTQYRALRPSTFTSSGRPYRTAIVLPSEIDDVTLGATTSCSPSLTRSSFRTSPTLPLKVFTCRVRPSSDSVTVFDMAAYPMPVAAIARTTAPTRTTRVALLLVKRATVLRTLLQKGGDFRSAGHDIPPRHRTGAVSTRLTTPLQRSGPRRLRRSVDRRGSGEGQWMSSEVSAPGQQVLDHTKIERARPNFLSVFQSFRRLCGADHDYVATGVTYATRGQSRVTTDRRRRRRCSRRRPRRVSREAHRGSRPSSGASAGPGKRRWGDPDTVRASGTARPSPPARGLVGRRAAPREAARRS